MAPEARTLPVMPGAETYGHGHDVAVVFAHGQRTIADSAEYFSPHLNRGMRLVDVGCGPGSITCELAAAVAPGTVVGVDADAGVLRTAAERAAALHLGTVIFEQANAYALPHGDATFDAAHAHQLLQHLREPVAALAEMRRVVVPGGLVAARDADYGTMVHSPQFEGIERWRELYREVARRTGVCADAGRLLPQWFFAAGLTDPVTTSSSTWTFAEPARRRWWADSWTSRLLDGRLGELAIELELATRDDLAAMAADWDRWASHRSGWFAFLHGEVVARTPA